MSKKLSNDSFIQKLILLYGNKYDYSLVNYKNMHTKIKIICPIHGIFEQTPINILHGFMCKECKKEKLNNHKKMMLIEKANKIHNNKYDYSLIDYHNMISKVNIICPIHGVFNQSLNNHINQKKGCPKCSKNFSLTQSDFINRSSVIHNNYYDYSTSIFINVATKLKIICPIHGVFEQTPNNHLNGIGCPFCKKSKGEEKISNYLLSNNIKFIRQKKFKNCKDKKCLPFDFYLPNFNMCIEYDGVQHFNSIDIFGGEKTFLINKKHDKIKNIFCLNNNIELLRISYKDNIYEILNEKINKLN